MSWFMAKIYDSTCIPSEKAGLTGWRAELLSSLEGDVLEVGTGTGFNLQHYPNSVTRLVLSEPDAHMLKKFKRKNSNDLDERMELVEASLNTTLPMEDESFDAVVSTLVLCSVASSSKALREIWRVLRPGGQFVFLEHVAADPHREPGRNRWQRLIEPFWRPLMDNCHLRRETDKDIKEAGFNIESIKHEKIPKAPPWVSPSIRGIAHKPA